MKRIDIETKRILTSFIVTALFLAPFFACGQSPVYLGKEKNIDVNFLLKKAENGNFDGNIAAKIYQDKKNSYYAVDLSQISTRYEKIRILEHSYQDKSLTNIYNDINGKYLLFLVNNALNIPPSGIVDKLNGFYAKSKKEMKAMNEGEMKTWLKKHDKYNKKQ